MTNVTSLGTTYQLVAQMQTESALLTTLDEQLASGEVSQNLTDYNPTAAKQLVDYENAIVQRQSYVTSMQTVSSRLSVYDTTLSDLESVASSAESLAADNSTYDASSAANIQAEAQSYLSQAADDLNQQVNGRYIYSGTRYTTAPVSTDTSVLYAAPQTTITDGSTLPNYDSQAAETSTINFGATLPGSGVSVGTTTSTTSMQVYDASGTAHTVDYSWTKTGSNSYDLNVSSPDASYTATIPFTFDATTGALTSVDGNTGTDGSTASTDISLTFSGQTSAQDISLDFGAYGQTSGATALTESTSSSVTSIDVTNVDPPSNSSDAYTVDTALIDNNYSMSYGISSDNVAFQNLINGLRYINAAVTAGQNGDTATYESDMKQATTLLTSALSGIQTIHSQVAFNQNLVASETSTQNSDITALQNAISTIQNVDTATVSAEITALQAQLEASYTATGYIEKLSLVNYL